MIKIKMGNLKSYHLFLFLSITVLINPIRTCNGQQLFVFGDSLYDPGNKQFVSNHPVPANFFPYGMTLGRPTGRWSDGLIIPDYIAGFLGIPQVPPFLEKQADISHGASFAIADASVLGKDSRSLMTFANQGRTFERNKRKWTQQEREEALYLFYIGTQDYLNYTLTHSDPSFFDQENFINNVVLEIEQVLKTIYRGGGRKFAFQNLAPLGCLPVADKLFESNHECAELPTIMAALHNIKLLETLQKLVKTLDGFQFTVFNYYDAVFLRLNSVKIYGFRKKNACCSIRETGACKIKHGDEGDDSKKCEKPGKYLFFDGEHGTEKANEQMAHLMWSADPGVVGPVNLRELFVYPLTAPFDYVVSDSQFAATTYQKIKLHEEEEDEEGEKEGEEGGLVFSA
ncbi:GDSL esterase/lipase-like [Carica papaya]|uniref:GDSL esterase/lipase-like n=2 Tax=Carica papaya TaxID=3649 RepID=UPI000B8CCA70|nr:GDSL esterase/lipase-like [Carica papaya]